MTKKEITELAARFKDSESQEIISYFINRFGDKIALSSSLGAEDQVLTEMVTNVNPETTTFTLDTGRLFPETYDLIDRTSKKYNIKIKVYFPDSDEVEEMVNKKGINLFYDSIENRKECCRKRKLDSLKRAFSGLDAWICGLRADQSITRKDLEVVEWDDNNGLVKINPLAFWSEQDVWDYIKKHNIPYNPLHDKGYPSIGCLPCTNPVKPGEDVRAGRWWWENPDTKECGLHKK